MNTGGREGGQDSGHGGEHGGEQGTGGRAGPGDAWTVLGYLLSGLLVWGGVGLVLDRWLGTGFFLLIGLLVGMATSIYVIYVRYARR